MNQKFICQSCSMEIKEESHIGTNLDGSKNQDYCVFCYKDGALLQDVSMEEFIENSLQFAAEIGMSREEMRAYCKATLPTLKRWHCTCTQACASGYNPDCTCTSSECHCTESVMRTAIEFRPIDRLNYLECIDLTLEEPQKGYVAPNVFSLAQAAYEPDMFPLGIYYNSKMVGFILYDFDAELKAWSMSRFMVDKAHQGKGIGKAALAKFLDFFFEEHKVHELYTSVDESNSAAMRLYETMGFRSLELFEYDAGGNHFREMRMVLENQHPTERAD